MLPYVAIGSHEGPKRAKCESGSLSAKKASLIILFSDIKDRRIGM
jgi:hypothetical protein